MPRKLMTYIAVLAVGLGGGIGSVAIAADQSVHKSSATTQDVVTQLKAVNTKLTKTNIKLDVLNRSVGGSSSVAAYRSLDDSLDILNRSVGGYSSIAGSPSLRTALQRICSNTGSSC
jgi:hypothetical protein